MLFYFTATGNSLYVAKQLDEQCISIAQAIHDENHVNKADKIGVVCPIFGHEMPDLVKEFLIDSKFETEYFYLILTYGNYHGGASKLAKEFLESHGITPSYIQCVLMVDNYLPAFDMEEQKKIDKKVDEKIKEIVKDIQDRRIFISPVTDQDRNIHKEYLKRRSKMPSNIFLDLYEINDKCIGCGICKKICPKKCFTLEGQKSVWNPEGCISCMACIHACPMMAIQLKIPEKNKKARYRNENISICEIIDANNQWDEDILE